MNLLVEQSLKPLFCQISSAAGPESGFCSLHKYTDWRRRGEQDEVVKVFFCECLALLFCCDNKENINLLVMNQKATTEILKYGKTSRPLLLIQKRIAYFSTIIWSEKLPNFSLFYSRDQILLWKGIYTSENRWCEEHMMELSKHVWLWVLSSYLLWQNYTLCKSAGWQIYLLCHIVAKLSDH